MKLFRSAFRPGKRKERVMHEDYDRGKCAALIKEARDMSKSKRKASEGRWRECSKAVRMNHWKRPRGLATGTFWERETLANRFGSFGADCSRLAYER
jgi:hypothetical protein